MAVVRSSNDAGPELFASALRNVRVGVHKDLEVSRHIFRKEPCYVITDPLTFQGHRLDSADYRILVSLDPEQSLEEIFTRLVANKRMTQDDETCFYQFVFQLHRLGFLRLPISDNKLIFQRYQLRQRAKRREKLMGFLFLRIPVWNPSTFLDRTVELIRPFLGRVAFAAWLILIMSAGFVVARNWVELKEPLQGLLAADNLPMLWATLIALKVFHEFGHAYACRVYGGHVPEMGIFLIIFTPCAYVDASASWGFTSKYRRLIVCLAGMYIEIAIAAVAVFVWAMTGPSLTHALSYNVIFLASSVTVLFNLNPLMRFDGYYILSDIVEIPNLRQRSIERVKAGIKHIVLGLPNKNPDEDRGLRRTLLAYGCGAALYRVFLILGIAALVVSKFGYVWLPMAALFVVPATFLSLRRFVGYLWKSPETQAIRARAVAVSLVVLVGIPIGIICLPVYTSVTVPAVIATSLESVVRSRQSGFIEEAPLKFGQKVVRNDLIVRLVNDAVMEQWIQADASVCATRLRHQAYELSDPARAQQTQAQLEAHRDGLNDARARLDELTVISPHEGVLVECMDAAKIGSYVARGEPVAKVIGGHWRARALLTESEFVRANPKVGQIVQVRSIGPGDRVVQSAIIAIAPVGTRLIERDSLWTLTQVGGGTVAVNPATGEAAEPYFELTIDLSSDAESGFRYGMTAAVRLPATSESIATSLVRRLRLLWHRLNQE